MKALTCALALFLATPAMAQEVIDHPQWIYRDIDGAEQAAAVFLSWDYRSVIVRATCEEDGRLRIEYFSGVSSVAAEPMTLIVDERAGGMTHAFDAVVAGSRAEAERRLRARHGPALADVMEIVEGFDAGVPLVEALVSPAVADMLSLVAGDPGSPLARGLSVSVEQRFAA